MAPMYKKLVRDLIPERIRANGEQPVIRKLSISAFKVELRKKLLEEVGEFVQSTTREDMIEELADVQEVLRALYAVEKIVPNEVARRATKKRKERGGFEKRIFLEGLKK